MAVSAAVSVASFSVVLAQSLAAVAASSLMPATFLTLVRAAKGAAAGGGGAALPSTETAKTLDSLLGTDSITKALTEAAEAVTDIDLLVPKTARVTADFEFQATDGVSAGVAVAVAPPVEVVSINAGYSALYTSTSKNKIHLEIDFVAVNYTI